MERDMRLSTRGDYAVRAVLELAVRPAGVPFPLREIAARTGVPEKYLEQILMRLRVARILSARRGARGGYLLARPAEEITVGEIVRVMDGPLAPIACASKTAYESCPASRCSDAAICTLRGFWTEVRDAIVDVVDHTTFADLAARVTAQHAAQTLTYQI